MRIPRTRNRWLGLLCVTALVVCGCSGSRGPLGATGADQTHLEAIVASGTLRVGMSGDQPPLNFTSPAGEWLGIEVALLEILASNLDVELEIVKLPFHRLLGAVEAQEVDLAMSGITVTPKRNTRVSFVGPYFVSGKSVLTRQEVRREIPDPSDVNDPHFRLAALAGSTSEDFVRSALPKAQLVATETLGEAVQQVVSGAADALVADYETCTLAVLRNPDAELVVLGERMTVEPMGIAVRHDDVQLANLLEQYLAALRINGGLDRIYRFWLDDDSWLGQARRSQDGSI